MKPSRVVAPTSSERASQADVVGALVGGLLRLVVDLIEVGRGDGMCMASVAPGGFLSLVPEF